MAGLVCVVCVSTLCAQETDSLLAKPDPVVEAIASAPRNEPADYARAVFVLAELGQTDRAKPILAELIAQQLDDAALAALVDEFGSAKFLRLANNPAMGPEAAEFAGKCMAAAAAVTRSPERLGEIIDRLDTEDDRQRVTALVDLKTTGVTGAERLLAELAASAENQTRQNRLRRALVALAPESTPLLVAALNSGDPSLTPQAAVALAEVGDSQADALLAVAATLAPPDSELAKAAAWSAGQLTGRPYDFRDFEAITSRGIERYLTGGPTETPDAEGRVAVSRWDRDTKRATTFRLPADEAGVVLAAPLAGAQAVVLGDRPDLVRRGLVLMLEARAILQRAGVPAADNDDANPVEGVASYQLSGALGDALRDGRHGAAVALCGALAAAGDIGALATPDARPAPLAAALDAPHPAVRFAALEAVFQLNPPAPFPGSSRVLPALDYFAAGTGRDVVVVAMPNYDRSADLGGRLSGLQIRSRLTNRGCEAVELADTGVDVSAVFVDTAILDPHLRETVFRLRRQTASAGVPIAVLAGAGRLSDAERIAKEHTGVLATPRPHTDAAVGTIVNQLAGLRPAGWPDSAARAAHARQAAAWLAKLRSDGPAFYGRSPASAPDAGSGSRGLSPLPSAPPPTAPPAP